PNEGGRVIDIDGDQVPGVYVTGWIKRGPVGLIGHTKGDAQETIANVLADADSLRPAQRPEPDAVLEFLAERGVAYTTWEGWGKLDAHEKSLGESQDRARIKVVEREEMLRVSRA
ncbi:MAG: pyridine nucleotide-disulfide oxidoreductase, partial [Pseudonocardiaceae bacterium]